jgi:gliding motility-associated lipoprotein GldH
MQKRVLLYGIFLLLLSSCTLKKKEVIVYHKFENHSWYRYDKLVFNVPIEEINVPYDVFFFARHSIGYEFDNLDFAMIMNTPSGEERINQYNFTIKKKYGGFTGVCNKDSCEAIIAVKRGIFFSQKGTLKIEIENLVPRLEVQGLYGVGIKLRPAR